MISPHYGSAGAQAAGRDIVADPATGDVVVTGFYTGAPDVGAGPLPDNASLDDGLFVARYDAAGHARWARGFFTAFSDWIAFDGEDVVVGGRVSGDVDFGCGTVHGGEISSALVMKLRGSDGSCLWSRAFEDSQGDAISGAVDAAGDVLVATAGLVCDPQTADVEIVTAKLSGTDGSCVWARGLAGANLAIPAALAVDASGRVYVAGTLDGGATFAGHSIDGEQGNALLLAYDGEGAERWARTWGSPAVEVDMGSVAVTGDGRVWVAGRYRGTIGIGNQTFGPGGTELGAPFVAGFAPGGEPAGATAFTGGDVLGLPVLAASPSGALVVGASFLGAMALGGKDVTAPGSAGTLLASLDTHASLAPGWVRVVDTDDGDVFGVSGLRFDPWGDLIATGGFDATTDTGCGPMAFAGTPITDIDLFFARLAP
jgi:hypothetical protein